MTICLFCSNTSNNLTNPYLENECSRMSPYNRTWQTVYFSESLISTNYVHIGQAFWASGRKSDSQTFFELDDRLIKLLKRHCDGFFHGIPLSLRKNAVAHPMNTILVWSCKLPHPDKFFFSSVAATCVRMTTLDTWLLHFDSWIGKHVTQPMKSENSSCNLELHLWIRPSV